MPDASKGEEHRDRAGPSSPTARKSADQPAQELSQLSSATEPAPDSMKPDQAGVGLETTPSERAPQDTEPRQVPDESDSQVVIKKEQDGEGLNHPAPVAPSVAPSVALLPETDPGSDKEAVSAGSEARPTLVDSDRVEDLKETSPPPKPTEEPITQEVTESKDEELGSRSASDDKASVPTTSVTLPAASSLAQAVDAPTIENYARDEEKERKREKEQVESMEKDETRPRSHAPESLRDEPMSSGETAADHDGTITLSSQPAAQSDAVDTRSRAADDASALTSSESNAQVKIERDTDVDMVIEPSDEKAAQAEPRADLTESRIAISQSVQVSGGQELETDQSISEPRRAPDEEAQSKAASNDSATTLQSAPELARAENETPFNPSKPELEPVATVAIPAPEDAGIILKDPALEREAAVAQADIMEEAQQKSKTRRPPLRLPGLDDETLDQAEAPLYTPRTEAERERAARSSARKVILETPLSERDCSQVIRDNQRMANMTTLSQLHARVHGVPLLVSELRPLWREEDDKDLARMRSVLTDHLLSKRKRLNGKIDQLKQQYRTINQEWQAHCARLDRIIERREMQRRPMPNTPLGTPGGLPSDDMGGAALGGVGGASGGGGGPGAGGGGGGSGSFMTGRANRRNNPTGFAGFGDAVRSEAEFLEILASLENADMQDPNMRAARTTATAPDMELDPDSNKPLKLEYDDSNGFVADPVEFYLSDFDPDHWSEEEKAIFARRYALWPKQFGKIAQALPDKTPNQCVAYYYLNKKNPENDFKALAASRNRERKRKARVKPKKAKGSALMADLKPTTADEVEDDDNGAPSPLDAPADVGTRGEATATTASNASRRGGRSRLASAQNEAHASSGADEESSGGRKRAADEDLPASRPDSEQAQRSSDKKRSSNKSKRVKTEGDKSRRGKGGSRRASGEGVAAPAVTAAAVATPVPGTDVTNQDVTSEFAGSQPGAQVQPPIVKTSPSLKPAALPPLPPLQAPQSQSQQHHQHQHQQPPSHQASEQSLPSSLHVNRAESDLAAAEALGALAGMFGGSAPSATAPETGSGAGPTEADGPKAPKRRRKGQAGEGQEGDAAGGKTKTRQPTSSYWSVAERSEFLRSLALHGKNWDAISSTLSQKSAAQARNYFARNAAEPDFVEAASLAEQNAELPLEEREKAASAFARQKFTGVAPQTHGRGPSPAPVTFAGVGPATAPETDRSGGYFGTIAGAPRATSAAPASMQAGNEGRTSASPPPAGYRGLQINSLLNEEDPREVRSKRRGSIHEWSGDARSGLDNPGDRAGYEVRDERPRTADRIDEMQGGLLESRDGFGARKYEAFGVQRQPNPAHGYSTMPPPSAFQSERGSAAYGGPPRYATQSPGAPPHRALQPALPSPSIVDSRGTPAGSRYGPPGGEYRSSSGSSAPAGPHSPVDDVDVSRRSPAFERASSAAPSYPSMMPYQRYSASPGPSSIYSREPGATLSARPRPLLASGYGPSASGHSDRSPPDGRWHRVTGSPGPSSSAGVGTPPGYGSLGSGPYSTGNTYRSTSNPYTSYGSGMYGRGGAPTLPPLSTSAGRGLPPIVGPSSAGAGGGGAGSGSASPISRSIGTPSRSMRPLTAEEQRWQQHQQSQHQHQHQRDMER